MRDQSLVDATLEVAKAFAARAEENATNATAAAAAARASAEAAAEDAFLARASATAATQVAEALRRLVGEAADDGGPTHADLRGEVHHGG